MKIQFRIRLALDGAVLILLSVAFLYNWMGNLAHEIAGTALFAILIIHNVMNRNWWLKGSGTRSPLRTISLAINVALFGTIVALLGSSIIISRTVFEALAFDSTFEARQIHSMLAYVTLAVGGGHLGLHWSRLMVLARRILGVESQKPSRAGILRLLSMTISVLGLASIVDIDVASKIMMRVPTGFKEFETPTWLLAAEHVAVLGLFVSLTHYMTQFLVLPQCLQRSIKSDLDS